MPEKAQLIQSPGFWGKLLAAKGAPVPLVVLHPSRRLPGGGRVGVISPLSEHFCGSCNRLRLTAEGRLRTCLFSSDETDLRPLLRAGEDDRPLAEAIRHAVHHKPERHAVGEEDPHKCGLSMSRVGG